MQSITHGYVQTPVLLTYYVMQASRDDLRVAGSRRTARILLTSCTIDLLVEVLLVLYQTQGSIRLA